MPLHPPTHGDAGQHHPWSTSPADGIVKALLEVRALLGATVAEHREKSARDMAFRVVGSDVDAALEAASQLISRARSNIDVVLSSSLRWCGAPCSFVRTLAAFAAFAGEGLEIRLLCGRSALDVGLRVGDDYQGPFETRIGRISSLDAVIVDGRAALVRSDGTCEGQAVVVLSVPAVRVVGHLFGDVWRHARPVAKPVDFGGRARTEFAQHVLEMLYAGYTDEAAARELAVSVRTYRRYVAEIVEFLGAGSRFQAGVRAMEVGLLPTSQ